MIKSMTGYGGAKGTSGKIEISVEVKSVNNRYLDCTIKMPRAFTSFEESLKSIVHKSISRGKVDVTVTIDSSNADDIEIKVNHALAKSYVDALRSIALQNGLNAEDINVTDLTRYPDILQAAKREIDADELCSDICKVLSEALSDFNRMRVREGEKLGNDLTSRLDEIEKLTEMAEDIAPITALEYRTKLEARMNEVLQTAGIEEARILTEAAIFADRIAINEEIVRLRSHIAQLRDLLTDREPVGRKIDFLIQEFIREANTIGSKGQNARMSKVIVDMKSEIEKIREQAQNIE